MKKIRYVKQLSGYFSVLMLLVCCVYSKPIFGAECTQVLERIASWSAEASRVVDKAVESVQKVVAEHKEAQRLQREQHEAQAQA